MHCSQAENVIDFSSHLKTLVHEPQRVASESCPDVGPYIDLLLRGLSGSTRPQRATLRKNAVAIWNSCNIISVAVDAPVDETLARIRAFAFALLTCTTSQTRVKSSSRLTEIALQTAKECLRCNSFDLATRVLDHEAAAALCHIDAAEPQNGNTSLGGLKVEYYCLRILMNHKSGRADLADHCYFQLSSCWTRAGEATIENVLDLCHEVGRDYLQQRDGIAAAKWFQRAVNLLEPEEQEPLFAGSELRLSIMHYYAQSLSLLAQSQPAAIQHDTMEHARDVSHQLREEYGARLSISLLRLEMSLATGGGGAPFALRELEEIMKTTHLIDPNHRLIQHYVEQLTEVCPVEVACLSRTYILHRLIPEGNLEWVSQSLVGYIAILARKSEDPPCETAHALKKDLDAIRDALASDLGPTAAQAAHVYIWQMIHKSDNAGQTSAAILYCEVGLHDLFRTAGESYIGQLERQLISYHLLESNFSAARQTFENMSFLQQSNKYSRFLAYCIAINDGDKEGDDSCLNTICNSLGNEEQLLVACLGQSIQNNRRVDTVRILQRIVDGHLHHSTTSADVHGLLKLAIDQIICVVNDSTPSEEIVDEFLVRLCAAFRHAVKLCRDGNNDDPTAHKSHRVWYYERSFEVASAHALLWPKRVTIDLLCYSVELRTSQESALIETTIPKDSDARVRDATFIQALLYASEARSMTPAYSVKDLPQTAYEIRSKPRAAECRLVLYRQVFKLNSAFQQSYKSNLGLRREEAKVALAQLHALVPIAFEALLFLNASAYLEENTVFEETSIKHFIASTAEFEAPAATYAFLVDITLAFATQHGSGNTPAHGLRIPSTSAAKVLGQILQTLRDVETDNLDQAARWIRCVCQLILEDIEQYFASHQSDNGPAPQQKLGMLEGIVQQAVELASGGSSSTIKHQQKRRKKSHPHRYPGEELHWLAAKVFNLAVDLCVQNQHELARAWALRAVEVAKLLSVDGEHASGGLVEAMHERMNGLGLEV